MIDTSSDQKEKEVTLESKIAPKTAVFVVILLLFASVCAGFAGGWFGATSRSASGSVALGRQAAEDQSKLISNLAKQVGPSVVSINVTSKAVQTDPFFGVQEGLVRSAGTGFIISSDGYVLTNRHVVGKGGKISLTLQDGTKITDVTLVGKTSTSDSLDIAVLKINNTKGKHLDPVQLGDSSKLDVGDLTIAIGNALGEFQNTVTSGIVSGYGRNIQASGEEGSSENLQNLIQTDAAINHGNSGGPLIDINGQVIGINTAVAGGGAENIGFAIPINDVKGLIRGVLDNGKVERPFIGVHYVELTPALAKQLKVEQTEGAYIPKGNNAIVPNSPAADAGLRPHDIITKVNSEDVNQNNTLASVIGRFKVGEEVTLTIVRDGKEQQVKLKLEALPND